MATGYTLEIKNGEINTLKDFALLCCRSFGVMIDYKDEPMDKKIEKIEVDNFYTEEVERAEKALSDFLKEKRNREDAEKAFYENLEKNIESYKKDYEENKKFIDKCKSLLREANEWEVPNEDYSKLKKFMIDELESTIEFDEIAEEDVTNFIQDEFKNKEYFIDNYINGTGLKCTLEGKRRSLEKAKERVRKNNEWLEVLKKSFN